LPRQLFIAGTVGVTISDTAFGLRPRELLHFDWNKIGAAATAPNASGAATAAHCVGAQSVGARAESAQAF